MDLLLRPMRETDLEEVLEIERGAYAFPWSPGIFRDCLRVGYSCWTLELRTAVVAYGILSVGSGEAHLLNLCVRKDLQGTGLGRKVLQHLFGVAREHHADAMFLEVRPSNRAALRLYESMGFNAAGVRRAYYPAEDTREDALILARQLTLEDLRGE